MNQKQSAAYVGRIVETFDLTDIKRVHLVIFNLSGKRTDILMTAKGIEMSHSSDFQMSEALKAHLTNHVGQVFATTESLSDEHEVRLLTVQYAEQLEVASGRVAVRSRLLPDLGGPSDDLALDLVIKWDRKQPLQVTYQARVKRQFSLFDPSLHLYWQADTQAAVFTARRRQMELLGRILPAKLADWSLLDSITYQDEELFQWLQNLDQRGQSAVGHLAS